MKKTQQVLLFLLLALPFGGKSLAAKVDTVMTFSAAMNKNIPAVVITPDSYSPSKRYPVIYLLHGYSGDCHNWLKIAGDPIRSTVDRENVIIVTPDGGFSSWYFDVKGDPNCQYETYIGSELVAWIDAHYSTRASAAFRAITGLSMGGHGALFLAFRHPDVFGTAGSTSGGVDIRPFPLNWDLAKRLGSYAEHKSLWNSRTVVNLTHLIVPGRLKIIIDCGTEDFFFQVNCQLHDKLLSSNIPHDFIARPGKHDAAYWNNAIRYQLLFMTKGFTEEMKK
jgi:S-formylglutathione hydrolase FrmB